MNALIHKISQQIVSMANDFYHLDKSMYTLLVESGYFEHYDKISESILIHSLKMSPHLIQDWLRISDDDRSSTRWSFWKNESGKYRVAFWPNPNEKDEITSDDKFYSCAAYIKRRIERIRSI